jgi:cyclopropane fatty-acyl-phospholipid synthase-like methyltransferase
MDNIFNKDFWIEQWKNDNKNDTFSVHRGFSSPEYWDNAAGNYNQDRKEEKQRKLGKIISALKNCDLLFDNMRVLEIGCGTGMLAMELARNGAVVTAIDFSEKMLEQFRNDIAPDIEKNITILQEDWHNIDIEAKGWEKQFDLVIAFMSPGVASPKSFFKMMNCSKKGCAMQGWAAKRNHPILSDLWEMIKKAPLEDKPQSILYKINLLFSLGYFPEISFKTIEWKQTATVEEEYNRQISFFQKTSSKTHDELEKIIRPYLESIAQDDIISRKHKGMTAMAIWKIDSQG